MKKCLRRWKVNKNDERKVGEGKNSMNLELDGKRAIITGGSRGIGKSIALSMAMEGANVSICSRDIASLSSAASEIRKLSGNTVHFETADTTSTDSVQSFVNSAVKELGGIDILVNNAAAPGGLVMGPLDTADPDELLADIDTKVVGYLRVAKATTPFMKKQKWGRIINIGGLAARSGGAISGMRNIALTHFTKTLSNQLGPHGITVNIVHPGATRTERTGPLQEAQARKSGQSVEEIELRASSGLDIRRVVESEEIANLVTFLASEKASAITGESIAAGGGAGTAVFS